MTDTLWAAVISGVLLKSRFAVVVDPPHKGLSAEVIDTVCGMAPERVVYVSCDVATQARDLKRFASLGYAACEAVTVDMFPRTAHVETVCCLYHQKKEFISVPYEPKNADYLKQMQSGLKTQTRRTIHEIS